MQQCCKDKLNKILQLLQKVYIYITIKNNHMQKQETITQENIALMVEISLMFQNKTKEQAIEYVAKYIQANNWKIID
jgi:hypothetical protein